MAATWWYQISREKWRKLYINVASGTAGKATGGQDRTGIPLHHLPAVPAAWCPFLQLFDPIHQHLKVAVDITVEVFLKLDYAGVI